MRYRHILTLLLIVVLSGCGYSQVRDDPLGDAVDAPIGPDGLRVEDYISMDQQRQRQAMEMTKLLASTPDRVITKYPSPLKYPTVAVKYTGKPPVGILSEEDMLSIYRASKLEGDTVVYNTDIAQMTMILERKVDGEPYDYRELTATVPYGYCLDFIDENLGKESSNPKGYILRKVECSQSSLGRDY